ncbi:cytosolic leucyl tRNA synthetase [Coemansia brasiliensis]|uniref:leucine--tRNA ligase n=1 Tax=Coemansia brasiliensis TaxID=2650707 RepID=A0A9W8I782_9FUNG|nr:cytosolic leucyl tRNA synthetase [Coemansia brasiliensis]
MTIDEPKKTAKLEALKSIEKRWQNEWEKAHVFEANIPADKNATPEELLARHPKWMGTIPFPYMNSILHLGHGFTISKVEFAAGWERLQGKNVLFPFGFHVSGMPIKAAADKIAHELEELGPEFKRLPDDPEDTAVSANSFKKKSKMEAKTGNTKYQFQILQQQGLSNAEISKFADTTHWLKYYPSIAMEDIKALGCKIDWRRSFLTTDYNPYFDSFAQWQFNRLRSLGKIKFGNRYTIWSPKDGQPCMDHDRQTGEGVVPVKYTCVKFKVLEWESAAKSIIDAIPMLAAKDIYLAAATLCPETIYGLSNCFVNPLLEYGLFQTRDGNVVIATEHAARNMAHQDLLLSPFGDKTDGRIGTIVGQDLVGARVNVPLACSSRVFVLPSESIAADSGTGITISVPSEIPSDYLYLQKLEHLNLKTEWLDGYKPPKIISTPKYGDAIAPALCSELKITSPNDQQRLDKANQTAFNEGSNHGIMLVGHFKGQSVKEARSKVHDLLISTGEGFVFAEPESQVMSRSGDLCVVALCDQWYFSYSDTEWKNLTKKCLDGMKIHCDETRVQMENALKRLHDWACVRSYGLGSKVPWDPTCLIESLSDSTIYMAYYTVAHLLHNSLDGKVVGSLGILPQHMDDAAWDYVLLGKELPKQHSKFNELAELRRSFLYWYPIDIRSSGKDLVQNHLVFFMYAHSAVFPKHHWPGSLRINGHLMLNHQKMSKSTGNMISIRETCNKFGADATRLTLADAGDGVDDANFDEKMANAAVLTLYSLLDWITCAQKALVVADSDPEKYVQMSNIKLRPLSSAQTTADAVFNAEMDSLTILAGKEYEKTMYRSALKHGLYEFVKCREWYSSITANIGMHPKLLRKYIERQIIQICPITPHIAEHIWKMVLCKQNSIMDARWPNNLPETPNYKLLAISQYIKDIIKSARKAKGILQRRAKKKSSNGSAAVDLSKPVLLEIFITHELPKWQSKVISTLTSLFDNASAREIDDRQIIAAIETEGVQNSKYVMPFAQKIKKQMAQIGYKEFEQKARFDEQTVLNEVSGYLTATLECIAINIISLDDKPQLGKDQAAVAALAVPGDPSFLFKNA